jgi:hypothetical protein
VSLFRKVGDLLVILGDVEYLLRRDKEISTESAMEMETSGLKPNKKGKKGNDRSNQMDFFSGLL